MGRHFCKFANLSFKAFADVRHLLYANSSGAVPVCSKQGKCKPSLACIPFHPKYILTHFARLGLGLASALAERR